MPPTESGGGAASRMERAGFQRASCGYGPGPGFSRPEKSPQLALEHKLECALGSEVLDVDVSPGLQAQG